MCLPIIVLMLVFTTNTRGQIYHGIKGSINTGWGNTLHYPCPTSFDFGHSDGETIAKEQRTNYGTMMALEASMILPGKFSIGISLGCNTYNFHERGASYFFGNYVGDYEENRSLGYRYIGIMVGYELYENTRETISLALSATKEELRKRYVLYKYIENRWNIGTAIKVEYGRRIARHIHLKGGFYFKTAVASYLQFNKYIPYTFGATMGVEIKYMKRTQKRKITSRHNHHHGLPEIAPTHKESSPPRT